MNIKTSIFPRDPDKRNLVLSQKQLPTLLRAVTEAFGFQPFDNLLIRVVYLNMLVNSVTLLVAPRQVSKPSNYVCEHCLIPKIV